MKFICHHIEGCFLAARFGWFCSCLLLSFSYRSTDFLCLCLLALHCLFRQFVGSISRTCFSLELPDFLPQECGGFIKFLQGRISVQSKFCQKVPMGASEKEVENSSIVWTWEKLIKNWYCALGIELHILHLGKEGVVVTYLQQIFIITHSQILHFRGICTKSAYHTTPKCVNLLVPFDHFEHTGSPFHESSMGQLHWVDGQDEQTLTSIHLAQIHAWGQQWAFEMKWIQNLQVTWKMHSEIWA